jgi:tape measure domain-containing protein
MAVELATAYVSIVPSTRGISKQLQGEFDGPMEAEAKSSGGKFGSAFGTVAKRTMQATGVAVAAVFGKSLVSGFGRLQAIDDARFKLQGLGHDAEGVETIMESALDSVRGTAFGLGEAATIAAGAVAAGIEPGDELTRSLKLVGDAASIAGVGLNEMGAIFGKVAAGNRMMTEEMNQLTDRGLPVLQWLQDEFGITAEAAREMVSDGAVDFATFQRIIEKNIGGAALTAGESFRGSLANMGAALGRFGAALLAPAFEGAPSMFGRITEAIDSITPAAERFSRAVGDRISGVLDFIGAAVERFRDTFTGAAGPIERVAGGFAALDDAAQRVAGPMDRARSALGLLDDAATRVSGGLGSAGDATGPLAGGLAAVDDAATRMSDGLDTARTAGDLLAAAVGGVRTAVERFRDSIGGSGLVDQLHQFWQVFQEGDGILDGLKGVFESVLLWLEQGGLAQIVEFLATAKIRLLTAGAEMFSGLVEAVVEVAPKVIAAVADAIPSVVDAVVAGVPLLLDAALILFTGLIDAVVVILPQVAAALADAIPRIVQAVVDAVPLLLDAGLTFFTALVDAILVALPVIIEALLAAIPPIVQAIVDAVPQLLEAGIELFLGLADAVTAALPVIIDALVEALPEIVQTVVDAVPLLLDAALTFFSAIVEGLLEALPDIVTAIADALPTIIGVLAEAIPQLVIAGVEFFLGLVEALVLAIPQVVTALVESLPAILDAIVESLPLLIEAGITLFLGLAEAVVRRCRTSSRRSLTPGRRSPKRSSTRHRSSSRRPSPRSSRSSGPCGTPPRRSSTRLWNCRSRCCTVQRSARHDPRRSERPSGDDVRRRRGHHDRPLPRVPVVAGQSGGCGRGRRRECP